MSELPDVEGFRALLAEHATGHRVERVDVADADVLRGTTARQMLHPARRGITGMFGNRPAVLPGQASQ